MKIITVFLIAISIPLLAGAQSTSPFIRRVATKPTIVSMRTALSRCVSAITAQSLATQDNFLDFWFDEVVPCVETSIVKFNRTLVGVFDEEMENPVMPPIVPPTPTPQPVLPTPVVPPTPVTPIVPLPITTPYPIGPGGIAGQISKEWKNSSGKTIGWSQILSIAAKDEVLMAKIAELIKNCSAVAYSSDGGDPTKPNNFGIPIGCSDTSTYSGGMGGMTGSYYGGGIASTCGSQSVATCASTAGCSWNSNGNYCSSNMGGGYSGGNMIPAPVPCPTNTVRCPNDMRCSPSITECSSNSNSNYTASYSGSGSYSSASCPTERPIKCPDMSCALTMALCPTGTGSDGTYTSIDPAVACGQISGAIWTASLNSSSGSCTCPTGKVMQGMACVTSPAPTANILDLFRFLFSRP